MLAADDRTAEIRAPTDLVTRIAVARRAQNLWDVAVVPKRRRAALRLLRQNRRRPIFGSIADQLALLWIGGRRVNVNGERVGVDGKTSDGGEQGEGKAMGNHGTLRGMGRQY